MEGQGKAIIGEGNESRRGREVTKPVGSVYCDLLLRLLAFALTLVATIVVGVDKQTTVVSVKLADGLPPLDVPVSAKWHYLSAFVYFMVANAIACTYGAISMLLTFLNRGKSKVLLTLIIVLDALMVALLFSGIGAAAAVGLIGFQGNTHLKWNKVCNVFDKFCHQVAASIILSLLGSVAFLLLVVLPILRFQRKNLANNYT